MSDPSYPDALPTQFRLHWYVLERVLGQGGFGITYLARDTNLDQTVAIKEYLPVDVATRRPDATVRSRTEELSERYRWGLERFIREARTLAKFDHPSIVRVHSVFEINNTAYMVMRFEEGENLAALLERRRTLPEADLLRIVLPILDGLALVHNAGFIHRDIKPDNIYIRDDGSPVLLDFGSARHSLGHARTVTILVAPGYAPFEQYYSSGENQGPWTDLYSLGATCYRAIAGIEPMDAIARSKGILGSTREILVPAAMIGSARYSPGVLAAVDHALQFSETDRPQSIAEWRRELASAGDAEPAQATTPAAAAASATSPAGSVRGPVIWATLGGLVAAAMVAGAMIWARQEPARTPPADDQAKRQEEERRTKEARHAAAEQAAADALKKQREQEAAQKALDEAARKEQVRQIAALQLEFKRLREQRLKEDAELKQREQKLVSDKLKLEEKQQALARIEADRIRQQEQANKKEAALKEQEQKLSKPVPQPAPAPVKPTSVPGEELLALAEQARNRGDNTERLKLLRKAGRVGNPKALFELGDAYASGSGVEPNNFEAYVWFRRAEIAGHKEAAARVQQVKTRLQPAEVAHAERLLR